jgi:hypothetical protein
VGVWRIADLPSFPQVAAMQDDAGKPLQPTTSAWRLSSGGSLLIRGGSPLTGTYPISGAKNAVLPLMVSALQTPHPVALHNVPDTLDVAVLATLFLRAVRFALLPRVD